MTHSFVANGELVPNLTHSFVANGELVPNCTEFPTPDRTPEVRISARGRNFSQKNVPARPGTRRDPQNGKSGLNEVAVDDLEASVAGFCAESRRGSTNIYIKRSLCPFFLKWGCLGVFRRFALGPWVDLPCALGSAYPSIQVCHELSARKSGPDWQLTQIGLHR